MLLGLRRVKSEGSLRERFVVRSFWQKVQLQRVAASWPCSFTGAFMVYLMWLSPGKDVSHCTQFNTGRMLLLPAVATAIDSLLLFGRHSFRARYVISRCYCNLDKLLSCEFIFNDILEPIFVLLLTRAGGASVIRFRVPIRTNPLGFRQQGASA